MDESTPLIVGIGGSTRPGSSTELAVRWTLDYAATLGARTIMFDGPFLTSLPHYAPGNHEKTEAERAFIEAIGACHGLIVGSPGYHGTVSGLIKNALDTIEELSGQSPAYLDGRAFGCIVTAKGWQACGTTLIALRTIAHALRAWPTPLGVALNVATPHFDAAGACTNAQAAEQLRLLARQVVGFRRPRDLQDPSKEP